MENDNGDEPYDDLHIKMQKFDDLDIIYSKVTSMKEFVNVVVLSDHGQLIQV